MNVSLVTEWLKRNVYYIAWLQALVATSGSLFFSEVEKFTPCILCWYQRVCMYPLVILLTVGIVRKDTKVWMYGLPLTVIGLVIAVYHNLLYYKILPESAAPCTAGVSCTTKFIEWFGFITIPLLSLAAFAVITACFIFVWRTQRHEQ